MGVVEGQTYTEISKRIIGTKALRYSDGVLALNLRQTQSLVSTAVAHTVKSSSANFL
jgi:hypothetical protein